MERNPKKGNTYCNIVKINLLISSIDHLLIEGKQDSLFHHKEKAIQIIFPLVMKKYQITKDPYLASL